MAKMIQCKSCSKEIASSAKICPGCGAKNKKPIYKRVWFIVIVLLIIVGAINAAGGGNSTTPNGGTTETGQVENSTAKKEKFELVGEVETETDQFATYLKGVIKNNSGKDCSYVQVTFNLYDSEGNQIGTALDNINNLESDGTWKFKAMGIDVDGEIASYKLAEITGF
ncbi:FxLYD domain-containing protein [Clostridium nigeriense]|uniref:FxLYD domain-containing protein n=1 Tax=Clostridium nigeriense TaxID=1805470 RepID=UPI003D355E01